MGDTDSEAVFCAILNALRAEYGPAGQLPPQPQLFEFLAQICREIVQVSDTPTAVEEDKTSSPVSNTNSQPSTTTQPKMPTIFNFLLACGPHTLFAYSWPGARPGSKVWNGLHYLVRQPPVSTATLIDDDPEDECRDFPTVTTPQNRVALITTKPLTHEPGWVEVPKGQLVLLERGHLYWSAQDILAQRRDNIMITTPSSSVDVMNGGLPQEVSLSNHHNHAQQLTMMECDSSTAAVSDGEDDGSSRDEDDSMMMMATTA
eukprot:CAMPEP_0172476740 /NCGR_PEP_ID=MMETSP1065-20121228/70534_1 /TAXON_ID=265537 /ORGANISM="Amphiprora paludosa, Strain CCMP125" /LENGTH=259 /DNA_ID=CAMNT_0013234971 /DNA_START=39 /DNA_END=818 /DNA_ORIENTATION=-